MSGIVGIFDLVGERDMNPQLLDRMMRPLAHRAPAGTAAHRRAGTALGVLLGGGSPGMANGRLFASPDERLYAALDGRIFNRAELVERLRQQAQISENLPEAGLIAYLYALQGPKCLSLLEGEFAFVIWDAQKHQVFAARDRLGVRHLFYTEADGLLYMASEIKALLATGAIERRLDPRAVDQALFMNCPVAPRTMIEGVSALPAGHFLLSQAGETQAQRYWDLEFAPGDLKFSEAEASEALVEHLRRAVQARLPENQPVGVYLSGGLDSSTITALMKERLRNGGGQANFPAYFVDFALPAFSERRHSEAAAEALGVPLNVTEMTPRYIAENFPRLIWHGEAPLVLLESASLLPLAQRAGQDVKVVLNGEGGDELMAGYVFNEWDRIYRRLQVFPFSLALPAIRSILPPLGFPRAFVISPEEQQAARRNLGCFPAPLYYNYSVREVNRYYSGALVSALKGYCPEADLAQTLDVAGMSRWDPLSQSLYFSTKINLPNYLLGPHGDRAAAAGGLEAFYPFLDHRLVEFAARLPNDFKLRGRQEKYLLKQAVKRLLPEAIVRRKKSPMTSPTSPAFLDPRAPEYVAALLSPDAIEKKGYFDSQLVAQMVEGLQHRNLAKDRNNRMDVMLSFPLVGVLSVQIFDELFIRRFQVEPPSWS